MAKKFLVRFELIECSKLPQVSSHSLDLTCYGITTSEADEFFNILKLLPTLKLLQNETKIALFELIESLISNTDDKTLKYREFATAIGCQAMGDFLDENFLSN
jgi:hypothetical protein